MKFFALLFVVVCAEIAAVGGYAATSRCSKTNLTRCLDSVCAINASINPSARCQYCGTSNAGEPATKGLTNVTAGQSTKYALSAKELSVAPSDPGKRYVWATTECIKKLPDCTPDDASAAYDRLIEISCKNAGVTMQTASALATLTKEKTRATCNNEITACINKKCGADFNTCPTDATLDRAIAECGVDAGGCDNYLADLRKSITGAQKSATENRDALITAIVTDRQTRRTSKVDAITTSCKNGTATASCVKTMCAEHMAGKCATDTEVSMAKQLCKFYDTACTVLK